MLGLRFGVFALAVMILAGCAPSGPYTPIWERENSPAPVVESNVSGGIAPLHSGDTLCLHVGGENGGRVHDFFVLGALRRNLEERGIDIKLFSCAFTLEGRIRFVGWASSTAENKMLTAGYGSTEIPEDTVAQFVSLDPVGITDASVNGVMGASIDRTKLNLLIAVMDLEVKGFRGRWISKIEGISP